MYIVDNVKKIRENIAIAAEKRGISAQDITLVAATKTNSAENVRMAISAGVDACGENRVQELLEKYDECAYSGAPLHFIGALQSNKVKYLVGKVSLIQSVDSIKLVNEVSKCAQKQNIVQDILLEVNIGGEQSKSGIAPDELETLLESASNACGVRVRGLMTIPPVMTDERVQTEYFEKMYKLFIDICAKKYDNIYMDYLSMGMSDDYSQAILSGANMVRVGSAIFGARKYN